MTLHGVKALLSWGNETEFLFLGFSNQQISRQRVCHSRLLEYIKRLLRLAESHHQPFLNMVLFYMLHEHNDIQMIRQTRFHCTPSNQFCYLKCAKRCLAMWFSNYCCKEYFSLTNVLYIHLNDRTTYEFDLKALWSLGCWTSTKNAQGHLHIIWRSMLLCWEVFWALIRNLRTGHEMDWTFWCMHQIWLENWLPKAQYSMRCRICVQLA